MDKRQTNKKEMFDSVNFFLDSNPAKWSSIPKLVSIKKQFSDLIGQIELIADQQSKAKMYLSKDKEQLKRTVADKADILNDSLEAMSLMENNIELSQRMSDTFTDLFRMSNLDFIAKVKEIIKAADENTTELTTNYGVSQEQIDGLKTDADRFAEMNGLPRAYQVSSRQATTELKSLFDQGTDLLVNGLDKLMAIFRRSDPAFYNGYQAAREIVDN